MATPRPVSPSRRTLLLGALSAPVAAVALTAVPTSAAAPAATAKAECLADLIESGAVSRADLVAR